MSDNNGMARTTAEVDMIRRITVELLAVKYDIPREYIEEAEAIAISIIDDTDDSTEDEQWTTQK